MRTRPLTALAMLAAEVRGLPPQSGRDGDPSVKTCIACALLLASGLARAALEGAPHVASALRAAFKGPFILNGGYSRADADTALANGEADAVSFGEAFISNPDLPVRLRVGASLAEPDRTTYYGGDAKGYTDYPALESVAA